MTGDRREGKHPPSASRWPRIVRFFLAALMLLPPLLLALSLALAWWWTGSEGSLATALRYAARDQPLVAEQVTGSLRTGGRVSLLRWQHDGLEVQARDVTLSWNPWGLLDRKLEITQIGATDITVTDSRPARAEPSAPPESAQLPWPVEIRQLKLSAVTFKGSTNHSVADLTGHYRYDGTTHQLTVTNAQIDGGRYSGVAILSSTSPLTLDAQLAGTLQTDVPGSSKPIVLSLQATARGPLADLIASADLQLALQPAGPAAEPAAGAPGATRAARQPQANLTARLAPWAAQPVRDADAQFHDFDPAALWPALPHAQLTGRLALKPLGDATGLPDQAWALQTRLENRLPGPWDQRRVPVDALEASGEWRGGTLLVRALKATRGQGELQASGEWERPLAPVAGPARADASAGPAWRGEATLKNIDPASIDSRLASGQLSGRTRLTGRESLITFDTDVATAGLRGSGRPATPAKNADATSAMLLALRSVAAKGSWDARRAGGTLALSSLRVQTDDAELRGSIDLQPRNRGGQGALTLTAPGLNAQIDGELRESRGNGNASLAAHDAALALGWLKRWPTLPNALQQAAASGNLHMKASWQGGWRDPELQARLDLPALDWQRAGPEAPTGSAALRLRAVQVTLSGRLSQAQLALQGRVEVAGRRIVLQADAAGGRSAAQPELWRGLLQRLDVQIEDPAPGPSGNWRLRTRDAVALQWRQPGAGRPLGDGAFESGAGQAWLSASDQSGRQALIAWQPIRWQPGEFASAGKLSGVPLAWLESLAERRVASANLVGDLLFEGSWDVSLGNTVRLKAELARSSGDLVVQAETVDGTPTRVVAGIREARVSIASDGEALALALRWDSERTGTADGTLATRLTRAAPGSGLGGWQWPADAPLKGQAQAQFPRLGLWSVLAPPGWRLRGALAANVTVGGTRATPQLAGTLQASDMALRSVVDGIEFGNGRLAAQFDGTRLRITEFSLQGVGEKGAGGTLTARGEAGWIGGKPSVRLEGRLDRLRASLRTDRQATVSGDFQASLSGAQSSLTGTLRVDSARIMLPEENTPQLGNDVVVRSARGSAAGQQAPANASTAAGRSALDENRAVKLALKIDLGPDFRVAGKGLETRLTGVLNLAGESLASPRLTGVISTAGGEYRAYGQRLDVERGVLRFTGPIDNPTLDILAIRPNLIQRVGVEILGTAQLPRVRLYAQPDLSDAEKLSWLIVGRASASGGAEAALVQQAALALLGAKTGANSSGLANSLGLDELSFRGASSNADGAVTQAAVTLGKRFSRNFYASYERNISGAIGTLFLFYDLSQRFTVRGQAGRQGAIDLIYTIPFN